MIESQEDFEYEDYDFVTFISPYAKNLKMSIKTIALKSTGIVIPVVHIECDRKDTGDPINFDMFPYYDVKGEDLKNLPVNISEVKFRIGYKAAYDPVAKKNVLRTSNPYWLRLNPDESDEFRLSERFRKYYLFFDTETTGTPKNYDKPTSDTQNWPHIVQLSWIIEDFNGHVLSCKR